MMLVREIFSQDIERYIPPVIYFQNQSPEDVAREVSEYIITGGWPRGDARHARLPVGIHEQFVRLLTALRQELERSGGPELPASWISGFYGSGKSSFAKLLGLALDGQLLPDGRAVAEALLARDQSPLASELGAAWAALTAGRPTLAVLFDIGTAARSGERIHTAARRKIQERLGYAAIEAVADYELRLERAGRWEAFLAAVEAVHGEPWSKLKRDPFVEDLFSEVMHHLEPDRYLEPLSWSDRHAGQRAGAEAPVEAVTQDIGEMLERRAPGATLFVVVDEVSQYIHQDDRLMLGLQSMISDLGQKLRGRVWLLATGQQKLEDDDPNFSIGKLKDRFPPHLRVHLAPANIRDVIHRRLLEKTAAGEEALQALFARGEPHLRLHGFQCQELRAEEFVETYPMLPGQIELLLQITSALRARSDRAQGDNQAIRGLLQLIGELFRRHRLGDQALGALVTLDQVYDIQETALDADTQNTLGLVFAHESVVKDPLARRAVKAVALLQQVQDQEPWVTTAELVARCLYEALGAPANLEAVKATLERLQRLGLLGYTERYGYKLMSSAGQEWQRERDRLPVTEEDTCQGVQQLLAAALRDAPKPSYKRRSFPWHGLFSDQQRHLNQTLQRSSDLACVRVHFHWVEERYRQLQVWIHRSATDQDVLHWVVGEQDEASEALRQWWRSREMVQRYQDRIGAEKLERQQLFYEEKGRAERLRSQAVRELASAFLRGAVYFRGRVEERVHASDLSHTLERLGARLLPELYPHYLPVAVREDELRQLLQVDLSGVSPVHVELGILSRDGGRYEATCKGELSMWIKTWIEKQKQVAGVDLLNHFGGPPFGYSPDLVREGLLGLLRGHALVAQPESGAAIKSVRDVGVEDLFVKGRGLARVTFSPGEAQELSLRERGRVAKLFTESLGLEALELDLDSLADAAFAHLPRLRGELGELRERVSGLSMALPESLHRLEVAIDACSSSRNVEPTVHAVLRNLEVLREGVAALRQVQGQATELAVEALRLAQKARQEQIPQLKEAALEGPVGAAIERLEAALAGDPWGDAGALLEVAGQILDHYRDVRHDLVVAHRREQELTTRRLRQHPEFHKLTADKVQAVERLIYRKAFDTDANAVWPSLVMLRDAGPGRLQAGLDEALLKLEQLVIPPDITIVEVSLPTQGRLLASQEDIEDFLQECRQRLRGALAPHHQLRLK